MSLTDREHHDAYEALQGAFGENTDAVIRMLRPDDSQLVTKDDLAGATATLRTEMAEIRTEMKTQMADLRTEMKTEMADLRADLVSTFELRITEAFQAQTRTLMLGLVVAVVLMALSNSLALALG